MDMSFFGSDDLGELEVMGFLVHIPEQKTL